jgi:hypothetical protein
MKNAFALLLTGLLLCGCSQKQTSSAGRAIGLIQAGKDTTWSSGAVLHVTKRDGTSLQGVKFTAQSVKGETTVITADTATLSPVPFATDGRSVMITFHNATSQTTSQTGTETKVIGESSIPLHE